MLKSPFKTRFLLFPQVKLAILFKEIPKYAKVKNYKSGRIKRNDNILLAAFGSGFTWGSAFIKW